VRPLPVPEPFADPGVAGWVLCRAGGFRVAFAAHQVLSVEAWHVGGPPAPHARAAFRLGAADGRMLISETGEVVVVDALEVFPDALPLLPVPPMLTRRAGGSLRGFVSVNKDLYPVLRLSEFSRFLAGL
jgi:hypothetical protein